MRQQIIEQYEELRLMGLRTCGWHFGGHGLALLMNRGMVSWIQAMATYCTPKRAVMKSCNVECHPVLTEGLETEVSHVLAQMVISTAQEVN